MSTQTRITSLQEFADEFHELRKSLVKHSRQLQLECRIYEQADIEAEITEATAFALAGLVGIQAAATKARGRLTAQVQPILDGADQ